MDNRDLSAHCSVSTCTNTALPRSCHFCSKHYCSDHDKIWIHSCSLNELDNIEDRLCSGCRCMRTVIEELPNLTDSMAFNERELADQNRQLISRIRELEGHVFDQEQELLRSQSDLHKLQELREENLLLTKRVFTLEEVCQKFRERLASLTNHCRIDSNSTAGKVHLPPPSLGVRNKCLERELEKREEERISLTRERDYYKAKFEELESYLKEKELEDKHLFLRFRARREADKDLIKGLQETNHFLDQSMIRLNRQLGLQPSDQPQRGMALDDQEDENYIDLEMESKGT